jgi:hypothetical protein
MRYKLLAALLMTVFAVQRSPGAQSRASSDSIFFLHINQPVDPEFVAISYLVKGEKNDDGYGNFGRRGPNLEMTATQDIPISLTLPHSDHRATAIRAVLFCRGYRLAFVNVPSLASLPTKRAAVNLVPLGSVALTGRVTLPKDENPADLRLDVYYENIYLVMGYLETSEAIGGSGMKVSTTTLAADGSFKTTIPDFANDPEALKSPGRFNFTIRSPRPYHGASERTGGARIAGQPEFGPLTGIPLATSYPAPIALEFHWP